MRRQQHICFDSSQQSRRGREPLVNPLPVAAPRHGTFPERANVPPTSGNRHKGADPAEEIMAPDGYCELGSGFSLEVQPLVSQLWSSEKPHTSEYMLLMGFIY